MKDLKEYTLFHKNIPVAALVMNIMHGNIVAVKEIMNMKHLPIFSKFENNEELGNLINRWWIGRSMPSGRPGLKQLIKTLGLTSEKALLIKSMGISLTDQYWVCPVEKNITWNQVNFFENVFSNDIGDMLFGWANISIESINYNSPDITTDGDLHKTWRIIDGKRMLVKDGSPIYYQEPLNEVIASKIMDRLSINHVKYDLIWKNESEDKNPMSVCDCFITPETELIKASQILEIMEYNPNKTLYQHFIECCLKIGINDIAHSIDQMLFVDFLIANDDRHINNFGLIRNADTLEWIGFAPIYDCGNSLWYQTMVKHMSIHIDKSKPFSSLHYQQIKYISNFDRFDLNSIKEESFIEEITDILKQNQNIDEDRANAIILKFKEKICLLEKLINAKISGYAFDPESDPAFNPDCGKEILYDDDNIYDPFEQLNK